MDRLVVCTVVGKYGCEQHPGGVWVSVNRRSAWLVGPGDNRYNSLPVFLFYDTPRWWWWWWRWSFRNIFPTLFSSNLWKRILMDVVPICERSELLCADRGQKNGLHGRSRGSATTVGYIARGDSTQTRSTIFSITTLLLTWRVVSFERYLVEICPQTCSFDSPEQGSASRENRSRLQSWPTGVISSVNYRIYRSSFTGIFFTYWADHTWTNMC